MQLFVPLLAVRGPGDTASHCTARRQGDGVSVELRENTAASQLQMRATRWSRWPGEPRGLVLAAFAGRLARTALPGELGERAKSEWQLSGHRDTVRSWWKGLLGRTQSKQGVCLFFLIAVKNDLRRYVKIHIK